ncbi:MAG: FG-GAP-like repeat-containing protein [Polyangiales bacterium]
MTRAPRLTHLFAPASPAIRRLQRSGIAALAALAAGCDGDTRPGGLVDAGARDVSLPDIVFEELPPRDVPSAPMDAGPDAGDDAGTNADVALDAQDGFTIDVNFDAPPSDCCADAAMIRARPLRPPSGGYVPTRRPVFRWTPQAGAARYRVEVGDRRTFDSPAVMFTTTDEATTLIADANLPVGRAWWRVVPISSGGQDLTPTATWSLIVGRAANDLNGDGFADIVIGAPEHDAQTLTDAGRVQVFFGGGGLDGTADVTFDGTTAGEGLGRALSSAGDVNGDGFADLVVGAPFAPPSQSGRVLIYLGGTALANAPALTLAGPQVNAQFGRNVSIVGDLNGDGFDDVVVSTPFFRGASGVNAGKAWVFFGGSPMNDQPDVELEYTNAGDQFGFSAAGAGDVNGDGFLDVIVGAPRNASAGVDGGGAYVWWGGEPMDTGVDVIHLGLAPGSRAGDSVSGLGDFNGDGYADVGIGAVGSSLGGPNSGVVLGVSGGTGVIPRALFMLQGVSGERLGSAVVGGGDLDGDGFDDMVLGARDNSVAGALSGRAYAYRGGALGQPTLAATYAVSSGMMAGGDEFGFAVSIVGDANGDGFDDVLVGAPNAPWMGTAGPGRVYLFSGGASFVTAARQTYAPSSPAAFGYALTRR